MHVCMCVFHVCVHACMRVCVYCMSVYECVHVLIYVCEYKVLEQVQFVLIYPCRLEWYSLLMPAMQAKTGREHPNYDGHLEFLSSVHETKYTFICLINYHVSQIKYLAKQISSNTNMN